VKLFSLQAWGWCLIGALLVPALSAATPKGGKKGKAAGPSVEQLAWMAGSWRFEKEGRVVDEHWLAPAGGLMVGTSRTLAKGKALEFEFMMIREGAGGLLFFVAWPSGKAETAFPMTSISTTQVVFENPANDFPQKITYARQADGSLLAWIEGPGPDGQTRRIEFPYKRPAPP
jgi:hypothetical protein